MKLGHFATLLVGAEPREIFALAVMEDIPQTGTLAQDLLNCDHGKWPQLGDICIIPFDLVGLQGRHYGSYAPYIIKNQTQG